MKKDEGILKYPLFPSQFSNYFGIEQTDQDATLISGQRRGEEVLIHTRIALTTHGLKVLGELISKLTTESNAISDNKS